MPWVDDKFAAKGIADAINKRVVLHTRCWRQGNEGGYRARAQGEGLSKVALWYVGSEVLHLAAPKFKAVALGVRKGAIHDQAAGCKGER